MTYKFKIRDVEISDLIDVLSIFNYYIKSGFAAYSENEVDIDFFKNIKQSSQFFYVLELGTKLIGFCFLRRYLPFENFKHVGVLTYFIDPEYTHKGFGSLLLNKLINKAKNYDIHILLVNLSSLNHQSLNFHKKHGFCECGRFENIARKFDKEFDIIWMQRNI